MMGKSEAAGRVLDSSQSQPSDAPKSAVTEAMPSAAEHTETRKFAISEAVKLCLVGEYKNIDQRSDAVVSTATKLWLFAEHGTTRTPGAAQYCHFCGKTAAAVAQLIAGPISLICNECVDLATVIIAERGSGSTSVAAQVAPPIREES